VKHTRSLAIVAFTVICTSTCRAQTSDAHLSVPTGDSLIPNNIVQGNNALPDWYWDGNYLVAWHHFLDASPSLQIYDRAGSLVQEATLWFPGAATVTLSDVTITRTGQVFVSGGTTSDAGQVTQFIGKLDGQGKLTRVVRTTPFIPVAVCATSDDDTVWAYGFDRVAGSEARYDYAMLRHYSLTRGLLESFLKRSALLARKFPIRGWYPGQTNMRCTPTAVTIYNGPTDQIVSIDVAKKKLTILNVQPLTAKGLWTGFAITDDGSIFASFYQKGLGQERASGLFRLQLGANATAKWIAVPGTISPLGTANRPFDRLAGSDGKHLVYAKDRGSGMLFFAGVVH